MSSFKIPTRKHCGNTAINHKINILTHSISMEIIKDSFDPAGATLIDATNVSTTAF